MMRRKVIFAVEGDESGAMYQCDAIWHEGHWWLAPKPFEPPMPGQTAQLLLVRPLSGIAWESEGSLRTTLGVEVAKAVLDGNPAPGWALTHQTVQGPEAH